jgi:arylsulfatase A-like enzyme
LQQGYDSDVPHTHYPSPMPAGFFHPFTVWKNKGQPGDNLEDVLAAEAVAWLKQPRQKPFFMTYWAFEVHSPWQAKDAQIAYFHAKAKAGVPQRNPVYAGMLQTLDETVGRLIRTLEESGQTENTIIIFMGDNGGVERAYREHMPAEFQTTPVTSNLPLRAGKGSIYEGGVRVPLIVHWPGHTPPGQVSDALVSSMDWYPTLLAMLGLAPRAGQTFDGISIVPALQGGTLVRDTLGCHFPHRIPNLSEPASSIRQGQWKLIRFYGAGPQRTNTYELYDLAADPGEQNNLAEQQPDKVKELAVLLDAYLQKIEAVIPRPNPAYREKKEDQVSL